MSIEKEQIVEEIVHHLESGHNTLLVAPTGASDGGPEWGKTTLIPEVVRRLYDRYSGFVVVAPTLTLATQKIFPLLADFSSVILTAGATAPGMCPKGFRYYPQRFCSRCLLYKHYDGFKLPPRLSYQELVEQLPEDVCPYQVQRRVERLYKVKIGHFGRLRNLVAPGNLVVIDEFHEFWMPQIRYVSLEEYEEYGFGNVDGSVDLVSLKEKVELLLLSRGDDEKLLVLYDMLRAPAVWLDHIEGKTHILSAEIRDLTFDNQILGLTATPPPQWLSQPPNNWSIVAVPPREKKKAFVIADQCFYYSIVKWTDRDLVMPICRALERYLKEDGVKAAVFAPAALRDYLRYYTCLGDLARREFLSFFDAWGKARIGVDIIHDEYGNTYTVSVIFWPSLHVSVRRAIRSRGLDPDVIELTNAVQLAGRARAAQAVFFVDCRYKKHIDYISQFYDVVSE